MTIITVKIFKKLKISALKLNIYTNINKLKKIKQTTYLLYLNN